MKNPIKPQWIPYCTISAGLLGAALQVLYFATAVDEKGLLARSHPADILCWVLTAGMIVLLALCVRSLGGVPKYEKLFPASVPGAIGNFAGAAGIAAVGIRLLLSSGGTTGVPAAALGFIRIPTAILGFVSALCLVAVGYWRWKGQKPHMAARLPLILFAMLHLICQYRYWSSATQLQEYAFPLFGSVCLMLACYQLSALECRLGGRRGYVFFGQAAAFFCFLASAQDPLFYLPMGVWMFLDVCSLRVLQRRQKPEEPDAQGE